MSPRYPKPPKRPRPGLPPWPPWLPRPPGVPGVPRPPSEPPPQPPRRSLDVEEDVLDWLIDDFELQSSDHSVIDNFLKQSE